MTYPALMDKLQQTGRKHLYEATRDPIYGCGFTLHQADNITRDKVKQDSNLMGRILGDIRDRYKP